MRVSWKSIAPIFADVVVSPWNLLVGGLLIQQQSFTNALLSIIFGYSIIALIFILYGGLGFKKRKQSSVLLASVFGLKSIKYLIPLILALGQIGWAAINIDLGGRSLGSLLSLPEYVGIFIYAIVLTAMATVQLTKLAIIKVLITFSSLALMGYLFISKLQVSSISEFILYQASTELSLFWGTSIVVASMISFATITPDFFQSVKTKNDVILATILGLSPGMLIVLLGCFLFYDKNSLDLIPLLGLTGLAIFPHLFNAITNTDGSTAIYTPGLKLQSIFSITKNRGILIAASSSFLLALTQISLHLTTWLTLLSIIFPVLIGVCLAAFLFKKMAIKKVYQKEVYAAFLFTLFIAIMCAWLFPPVLISLLTPLLFLAISLSYLNLSLL